MAATTEEFLSKIIGLPPDKVQEFKHVTPSDMLEWTKESCPLKGRWSRIHEHAKDVLKLKLIEPLVPWADKWTCREFLRRATPREIHWTLEQNPYYPCIAYGVSYDACSDLGIECLDPNKAAYAFICDKIRRGQKVSEKEINIKYPDAKNVLECALVDLSEHPLFGVDLDRTHRRELVDKAGLEGANEYKRAQNKLVLDGDSGYVLRKQEQNTDLVAFIKSYLTAST